MQELIRKINKLKKEKKAVILAHNYQLGEIQDIADFVGDSLELCQKAAQYDARLIVFCGVHFMAETAAIICPDKKVIMPDKNAGCIMADMANPEKLRILKKVYPDAAVVAYVNTTAAVKAESHICCTSANAVDVVNSLDAEEVIFVPDKYLGSYVAAHTDKKIILWEGYCPTHARILAEDIMRAREEHPGVEVIVHPECTPEVIKLADKVLSTGGMCRYAKESSKRKFIIGTEIGIIYRLEKENPGKKFYPASDRAVCMNMKLSNLEKVLWALEQEKTEITIPEEIRLKAKEAIDRMLV